MNYDDMSLHLIQKEYHGTLKSYAIGFVASLILTMISFFLVSSGTLTGPFLTYTIIGLALLQALFQLLFFLHLGKEAKPRWETWSFYFMILVLFIVAFGSIWIIQDLRSRMMSDTPMQKTE